MFKLPRIHMAGQSAMKQFFLSGLLFCCWCDLRGMELQQVSVTKRSFSTFLWARQVVPHLHSLTPSGMASFVEAYERYFTSLPDLFNRQDDQGNTLLHRILVKNRNIPLFIYAYFAGASCDIENNEGVTVEKMLKGERYYLFVVALRQQDALRKAKKLMKNYSETLSELGVPSFLPQEKFREKRGVPLQELTLIE